MASADTSPTRWLRLGDRLVDRLGATVSGVAFWVGIAAPVAYLLVLVPGLRTEGRFTLLVTLLVVHYAALVLGHPHNNRSDG